MIENRHNGKVDPAALIEKLRQYLDPAGLTFTDLLEVDARETTNPGALTNPMGYYLKLGKHLAAAKGQGKRVDVMRMAVQIEQEGAGWRPDKPSCEICKGIGHIGENASKSYCSCRMGRELAKVERKLKAAAAVAAPVAGEVVQ